MSEGSGIVWDLTMVDLDTAIRRYITELGVEAPKIVRHTFKLMMADVIRITAPKSLAQGRKRVAWDIGKAVFSLDPAKLTRWDRLRNAVLARDTQTVLQILSTVKQGNWKNLTTIVPFKKSLHRSAQDSRMRVRKRGHVATLDTSIYNKYVVTTQGHVGFLRSGWAPAARIAGSNLPTWISRHTNPPGSAVDRSMDQNPVMTATHTGGKTTDALAVRLIRSAIERRARAMHRDVDQIIAGRASQLIK